MAIKNRANAIKESKENRSELPDDVFGLPKLRKYPMPDKKHILSAIKFFNYVLPENEKELAKNIKKKMKQYDISVDHIGKKNRLKNYLSEDVDLLSENNIKPTLVFDLGGVLVHGELRKEMEKYEAIPNEYIDDLLKIFCVNDKYLETCTREEVSLRRQRRAECK